MKMYTEQTQTKSKSLYYIIAAAAIAVLVVFVILFTGGDDDEKVVAEDNGRNKAPDSDSGKKGPDKKPDRPAPGVKGMTERLSAQIGPSLLILKPVDEKKAVECFKEGVALYGKKVPGSGELLKSRKLLNTAYISGRLPRGDQETARKALQDLAARTVLRPAPHVHPDDHFMLSYTLKGGDLLGSIFYKSGEQKGHIRKKGVIARNELNVPPGIILRVNGLSSATKLRAETGYKLIKGPFHLVVYLSVRKADLFLQDLFVRRFPICVGTPDTPTPTGFFRIAKGGMTRNSSYNPPVDSNLPNRTIKPGQPGYPLGSKGLNIKLEGIQQLGTDIPVTRSYAIHGTNEPDSIGQAKSMGCLRFNDEDMDFIYNCLQSYGEPDNPTISWTKWSTIWIRP